MYRSSCDPANKAAENLTNLFAFNDLNMKCSYDMCSFSSTTDESTSSPSISPSSENDASMAPACYLRPACNLPNTSSSGCNAAITIENLASMQQQQLLVAHQQQLAAAAIIKHQYAMAAVAGHRYNNTAASRTAFQQDDISKSLKMFAMLTAYSGGSEPYAVAPQLSQQSLDAVMQDFACNGYVSDDSNRFQLGMNLSNNLRNGNGNTVDHHNDLNGNPTAFHHHLNAFQQQNLNVNFNNKIWKMLPAQVQQQQHSNAFTAATVAASANIDYNSNPKKFSKRYNSSKNEKYASAKHCVFCENNNEPEAVVKSHAVRDSLGRVLCPKLRTYICPICKASGDMAHTVKYCPQKPIITMEDAIKAESFRFAKGSFYKQQMKV